MIKSVGESHTKLEAVISDELVEMISIKFTRLLTCVGRSFTPTFLSFQLWTVA